MKANSASLTLYHFEQGHHREVCVWHDQDHKPEVVGTVPHIFISQRWVATPELIAQQPPGLLEHHGGEYVNLYWSSGTPEELESNFSVLGRRLELTFPEAAESVGALAGGFVVAAYAPPEVASTARSSVMEAWVALRPLLLRRVFGRLRPSRI